MEYIFETLDGKILRFDIDFLKKLKTIFNMIECLSVDNEGVIPILEYNEKEINKIYEFYKYEKDNYKNYSELDINNLNDWELNFFDQFDNDEKISFSNASVFFEYENLIEFTIIFFINDMKKLKLSGREKIKNYFINNEKEEFNNFLNEWEIV